MAEINIVDFVPVRPVNPFDEHVAALIAAGEGKALAVTCTDEEYKSVKRKFREAATNVGYSARIREEVYGPAEDGGEDEWTIKFTVRPRKDKADASATVPPADAPAEKTGKRK